MTCPHCRSNAAYRTPTGWVCDVCGRYQPADAADYQWHGLPLGRVEYALYGGTVHDSVVTHVSHMPGRVEFSCWGPSPLLADPHYWSFMN